MGFDNSIEVLFRDNHYFKDDEVFATFLKEGYYIVFNTKYLDSSSLTEIMITGFHETRHAYQYIQIELGNELPFKYKDNQLTLKEWKKDFDNPKQPREMTKEEYLNRSTEVDAIAFSYYLAEKLLMIKQIIPEEIKTKVYEKVEKFKIIFNI